LHRPRPIDSPSKRNSKKIQSIDLAKNLQIDWLKSLQRNFLVTVFYLGLSYVLSGKVAAAWGVSEFAPSNSIGVYAKEIGSARNIVTYWQTGWSFDRDYFATCDIEIEVHNLSPLPARVVMDLYFVGRPSRLSLPHKLFSKRVFRVEVPPSYRTRLSLRSDVLRSREFQYAAVGQSYTSGYEIEGWILFARLPGHSAPFDKVSSNRAMLEHLDWFPEALREFNKRTHAFDDFGSEIAPEPTPSPEPNAAEPEPLAPLIVVRPWSVEQKPSESIASAGGAPAQTSPSPNIFITVTKATKIPIGRREEIIQPGTKVQLVARASDMVQVRYKGEAVLLRLSSTDLK
jgi:hypothetical protein